MRAVASRSNTLDAIGLALAYGLHYDNSQIFWLGDAVCTSHWDPEGTFLPIGFGNIQASQWESRIASLPQFLYGHLLRCGGLPNNFVDPRCVLALVFCHSLHCQSFGAKRAGQ